jgi:ligand-binding SRPBCC domain-containing protein
MFVGLRIVLDAPVDVVRDALRSPRVMVAVTEPLLVYSPLAPDGFPRRWADHDPQPVSTRMFGLIPSGDTHVDIDTVDIAGIPVQRDTGRGISGLFARMRIQHRMAATALPNGRTLLRDRLTYRMRPALLGVALWPGLWMMWQWRGFRMRALASSWRVDA